MSYDTSHLLTVGHAKQVYDNLKSAISALDETVNGEKNYIEGYKLITAAGADRGEMTPDAGFDTTELIPLTLISSGTVVTVDYGAVAEATIFGIYNSEGVFLDAWTLNANATSRQFTLSYTSYTDPTYFRFSFKHGYAASVKNQIGTITYWIPASSGGLVNDTADLQQQIDDTNDAAMLKTDYIDDSMVNRLDPSTCTIGYAMPANGAIYEHSSYFVTDYIPLSAGETIYFYSQSTGEILDVRMFAAYDIDKNVISAKGSNETVTSITQSGGMAFVQATLFYSTVAGYLPTFAACLATAAPEYIPSYNNPPHIKGEYIRNRIWVYATDTEAQVITKMISAYKQGDCDVYFDRATYNFGTELAKVSTDYGMLHNEIPIGHNCRYYFNGATLVATLDLANLTPEAGDDEFYCNLLGCQRVPNNFELHDGVLIATDTRYVVHDEASARTGSYKHLYDNMELHYHTSARQEAIRKCIGGGTGLSGVVEIVGCKFTTDATDACVSWHGNGDNTQSAEFALNVRNSYFSNSLRGGALATNQTARLFYVGNTASAEPDTYDGWTVTSFLNEVRS